MDILTTTNAVPSLSLQLRGEAHVQSESASPSQTESNMVNSGLWFMSYISIMNANIIDTTQKAQKSQDVSTASAPSEKPLLCKDILNRDQFWPSPDTFDVEFACTSESESGFTTDTDLWTDDEDEDRDEFVLCLTSRGARPLDSTSVLCPPLPRRLSFKPLEVSEDEAHESKIPKQSLLEEEGLAPLTWCPENALFQNEYFAVCESKIAGFGAFATKHLKYGDRILIEQPLFKANSLSLFKEFAKLDRGTQELALTLHATDMCKPGTPKLQAIWMANCFSTGVRDMAGLFPIASRFNHSCHPSDNVEYTFNSDDDTLEMLVKADKITAGEELTISYGIGRTPLDLYVRYGFRCRCGTCPGLIYDDDELVQW